MGEAGRKHVAELFDYRQVASRFREDRVRPIGNSITWRCLWTRSRLASIDQAKEAALRILLHNARGPFQGLPRTAGWGYPEPYTRDLMISALGFLATGNEELADALRRTLVALATNQTPRGLIPSLAHDPADRGASDTTPLFLFGLALYRKSANQPEFLDEAARKALRWMQYQSPDDMVMVAQLPTSDWRDEQWVMGFGLYVNTLVYAYLMLLWRARVRQSTARVDESSGSPWQCEEPP